MVKARLHVPNVKGAMPVLIQDSPRKFSVPLQQDSIHLKVTHIVSNVLLERNALS